MAWVRIDDNFSQHPKVVRAGPLGMAMQIAALCYCNRQMTDGFIPKQIASTLLSFDGIGMRMWSNNTFGGGEDATWELVVSDLVEAGIWEPVDGGWMVHDFLDYQPSKQEIQRVSEERRGAGRKGGMARAKQFAKQEPRQEDSNQLSKGSSKTEAKFKPVPVPVPIEEETPPPPTGAAPPLLATADDLAIPPALRRPNDEDLAVEAYNAEAERAGWPRVQRLTAGRAVALRARLREGGGLDGWRNAMARARASPFLTGDNDRGWKADFDFLCKSNHFTKLMEGGYDAPGNGANGHGRRPHDAIFRALAERFEEANGMGFGEAGADGQPDAERDGAEPDLRPPASLGPPTRAGPG